MNAMVRLGYRRVGGEPAAFEHVVAREAAERVRVQEPYEELDGGGRELGGEEPPRKGARLSRRREVLGKGRKARAVGQVGPERKRADEKTIQDDADRPHVGLAPVVATVAFLQHLGRHVVGRSDHRLEPAARRRLRWPRRRLVEEKWARCKLRREAKVGDLEHVVVAQKQVLGFQVAVHDAELVAVVDAGNELRKVHLGVELGHANALGLDAIKELATARELEDKEDRAFRRLDVLEDVVELQDVRVAHVANAAVDRIASEAVHEGDFAVNGLSALEKGRKFLWQSREHPRLALVEHRIGLGFHLERVVVEMRVERPQLCAHFEVELLNALLVLDARNELVLVRVQEPPNMLLLDVHARHWHRWRRCRRLVHEPSMDYIAAGERERRKELEADRVENLDRDVALLLRLKGFIDDASDATAEVVAEAQLLLMASVDGLAIVRGHHGRRQPALAQRQDLLALLHDGNRMRRCWGA
ncbi:hypothetical protein SPRG_19266 [Saprolegnia parasitica CBS 223.65]|uniref:Uncharacterized protein n=1 Tax=Saprolegnia parasitica (strain CBS 223.65) TaxID=695850 RepID=A0A067CWM8_SAPPC|nr:hypothetical protein SPRG_19266 [Saprolegnia parasitica CBS 223.65]KDO33650.1 hypothetical protein SPRG_19266 [Saprolegnia parasitica CBS 223.65]|eukprot:XP_012195683.1 hypothetical protein SPRG_19266 [Saprolegnia parasitica CBS 223.65]